MRSTKRRASLVGFAGVVLAVGIGSWAWACTLPGSHTGTFFICRLNVNCTTQQLLGLNVGKNANYSAKAAALTANITYNIQYVAGDHSADSDQTCEGTGTVVAGGGAVLTNGTGAFGLVTITTPNVTGVHTFCVSPGGVPTPQAIGANHVPLTLV